jgi:hypothetical protein
VARPVAPAAHSGLRPGEAAALRWEDLRGSDLTVSRALKQDANAKWIIGPPKTAGSARTLMLPLATLAALGKARNGALVGSMWGACGEAEGTDVPTIPLLHRAFYRNVKAVGLPQIGLYGMRHTHATLLLTLGVPVKLVSERLGHTRRRPGWTRTSTSFRTCGRTWQTNSTLPWEGMLEAREYNLAEDLSEKLEALLARSEPSGSLPNPTFAYKICETLGSCWHGPKACPCSGALCQTRDRTECYDDFAPGLHGTDQLTHRRVSTRRRLEPGGLYA